MGILVQVKKHVLFEILKNVNDCLTYKGLSYKRYPKFVYENIADKDSSKEYSSTYSEEESLAYSVVPF